MMGGRTSLVADLSTIPQQVTFWKTLLVYLKSFKPPYLSMTLKILKLPRISVLCGRKHRLGSAFMTSISHKEWELWNQVGNFALYLE